MSAVVFRILSWVLSPYFIRLLSIRREVILPIAVALGVIGAWGTGFTTFDVVVMFIVGVVGYLMRLRGYPMAPMVLGVLVGPIADYLAPGDIDLSGQSICHVHPADFCCPDDLLGTHALQPVPGQGEDILPDTEAGKRPGKRVRSGRLSTSVMCSSLVGIRSLPLAGEGLYC